MPEPQGRTPFAVVPIELLEASAESKGRLLAYCWLWHYAGPEDRADPSLATLSRKCRMQRTALSEELAWLEAEGWISGERRPHQSNVYRVRHQPRLSKSGTGGSAKSGTGGSAKSGTGGSAKSGTGGSAKSGTGGSAKSGTGVVPDLAHKQEALTRKEEIQEKDPLTPIDPAEPLATVGPDPKPAPTAPKPPAAPEPAAMQPTAIAQPLEPPAAAIEPQALAAPCPNPLAPIAAPMALSSPLAGPQEAAGPIAGHMEPAAPCSPPAAAKPTRKGRKPAGPVPLPPDAPPLEPAELEVLTAWWQLRCEKHPRANCTKLGAGNLAAIAAAADRGVLRAYLHKGEMAGWQSLDHAGRAEAIERLAAAHQLATNPRADFPGGGLHPENRMYDSRRPNPGQPSRRQQTMARLNNLFKPEDGGPDDHP